MKHKLLLLSFISFCLELSGQTFSEDVADIIYTHCANCHRKGEIGPFPLTTYEEVKNRANSIRFVVESRYMPPWKADQNYQHYQNENFLEASEIQKIISWVDAGTPQGNPANEPALPNFPTGSQVGTPDLVLSFTQSYVHKGNNRDEYRYFVLPTGLTEDKELIALEMRPGNAKIVHHTLLWADATGLAKIEDEKSSEYGFSGGGSVGFLGDQLPGFVPGQKPNLFPPGMSQRVPKGSDLVLQMHYAPSSIDQSDSSTVNLFFAKQASKRTVFNKIMLPTELVNGPFVMPPESVKTFHGVYKVPIDVSLLGIWPHCHMLGKKWEVYAKLPNGDQIPLIKIDDWDFNWQGAYYFNKLIVLPKGSEVHGFATYDNSSNNPVNPNIPPKYVTWGEGTSDEMYYLPLSYVLYQPGDENLILDAELLEDDGPFSRFSQSGISAIYPNPAVGKVNVDFVLNKTQKIKLDLKDLLGNTLYNIINPASYYQGQHQIEYKLPDDIPSGFYMIELQTQDIILSQKLLIKKEN
ncbi:MAG: T9SS type A sorting domain-containing protein [Saprospiraceae bacterium]|nr:T9SS type A sorting domain-containing protein [Saprospiraceae bacterium]